MHCTECGTSLRRQERKSFLQQRIYPIFGFYPWYCPVCRKVTMLRKRYMRKRRRKQEFVAGRAIDPVRRSRQQTPAEPE